MHSQDVLNFCIFQGLRPYKLYSYKNNWCNMFFFLSIRSSNRLNNPHLRAKLAEALAGLLPRRKNELGVISYVSTGILLSYSEFATNSAFIEEICNK